MTLTKLVHNAATGQVSEVPLTPEEIAKLEIQQAEQDAKIAAEEADLAAKAEARQTVLSKLGITADEVKLLLGDN